MLYLGRNTVVPTITVSGGEVASVITATNNTGSAILAGDKVWINQEDGENRLVDYYKSGIGFSNFNVYGQLEFSSKGETVKGFTTSSGLRLSDLKSYSTGEINSMEMLFKIHTPTEGNWTSNGRIINGRSDYDDFALDISQTNATLCFINSDSPIGNTVHVAPSNMLSDTDYWIKVTYDGTNLYGYYSLDGENYILQGTLEHSSNDLYLNSTYGYTIGNRIVYNGVAHDVCVWNGSIYLSESYIKINGEIWWQPYEQGVQKQISRNILINNASISDYFVDNSGIYKSFIVTSKSSHPYFNKVFNPENSTWKLITKIKTPTSEEITNNCNRLISGRDFFRAGIAIDLNNGTFGCGVGASTSGWSIGDIPGFTVNANTVYWLKLEFNGSKYSFSHSLDGINYIEDGYINSTASIGNIDNTLIDIGGSSSSTLYWRGEIDLSETNIEVDGKLWNDASETLTNITSDTQTGTAAENITAGSTGLVNVGAVIEPVGDKYKVGDRVNDDSNNPVGTVSSIFTDGNGQRYAVVCLDAVNRLASGKYLDNLAAVSGIPTYTDLDVWTSLETATTNTTAILATGASTSCSHCRSKSFIIDGVTYAGQLPNLNEVSQIFVQKNVINNQDPTASTYSSLVVPSATNTWSSSQKGADRGWFFNRDGGVGIGYGEQAYYDYKTQEYFVIPVLEIPLEG